MHGRCSGAPLVDDRALAVVLDVDLPSIWAATDEAVRTGILGGTPVRRFSDDLVRETAAAALPQPDRMRAHAAMVRYLLSDRDPGRRTAELAFHGLAALPLGDPRTAYDWIRRAAEAALVSWPGRTRPGSTPGGPRSPRRPGCRRQRRGLLLALARRGAGYDTTAAIDTLGTVADLAQAADDPAGIAEAALTLDGVTDPTELSRIRGLQQRALDGQPPGDSPHRARLLAQLAVTLLRRPRRPNRESWPAKRSRWPSGSTTRARSPKHCARSRLRTVVRTVSTTGCRSASECC